MASESARNPANWCAWRAVVVSRAMVAGSASRLSAVSEAVDLVLAHGTQEFRREPVRFEEIKDRGTLGSGLLGRRWRPRTEGLLP